MKFNFKKITSVLASAVMLGSVIGIAAAANYPVPFVSGGAANVAVVVGANAASSDYLAAVDVGQSLQAELSKQTATGTATSSTASGGDSLSIVGPGSDYINLDEGWGDVYSLDIDKNDLPDLLADGTYRNGENTEYAYKQTLKFDGNLSATLFADSDYKSKEPTLGYKISKNDRLLNYTLDFKKDVKTDISDSSSTWEDIENTDISVLGINYRIVDAANTSATAAYMTLLGGAIGGSINLDEEKTESLSGKDYIIKLVYVGTETVNKVQIEVNGERTNKLAKGDIYKLSDGVSIGIKDISYQNFAGGVMSAEYSLGASKLKIEHGQKLELDDEDVDAITSYITFANSAGDVTISDFTLRWVADDEYFITPEQELTLPGLESVKITMGDVYFPEEEVIEVTYDGTDSIELKAPIEDGIATINILYGSDGVNWTLVGEDSTGQLATDRMLVNNLSSRLTAKAYQNLTYNESTDQYFVVSYNSSSAAESYLVSLKTKISSGKNYTTFKNEVTGTNICTDVETSSTCKVGNSVLTVERNWDDEQAETITTSGNSRFDRLYTASGLEIQLPWLNVSSTNVGAAALTCSNTAVNRANNEVSAVTVSNTTDNPANYSRVCYSNNGRFDLIMVEEDKDGYLGKGATFNVSLGWTGAKTTVTAVSENKFSGAQDQEIGSSDVYVGYVNSKLATKSEFDTGGTQDIIKFTYHGGESYVPLFIAAPSVTIGAGTGAGTSVTELGSVTVRDSEVSSVSGKNLIVVGGSCINSVAAKILGSSTPICGAAFTTATSVGADQFLIKIVDSPYTTGKVAMLVAGYEAADTTKAVKYATTEVTATDVGTTLKKVTATYADVA